MADHYLRSEPDGSDAVAPASTLPRLRSRAAR